MIQSQIMQNHAIPVAIQQFLRNMPCHIIIDLRKILVSPKYFSVLFSTNPITGATVLTATKKLLVPSSRSKNPGNSFNHVSSPYMTSLPSGCAFSCASQVSWVASVEVVSDSAKFRITSRKEGMEPVVMALTRGMVIVGEVAWAVKGMALPEEIRLCSVSILLYNF